MSKEKQLDRIEYFYRSKNYEKLIGACDEFLKDDGENPIALNYKAIALYYLERYDESLEILNRNLELHPTNPYAFNNMALVHIALGDYEKALECAEEGLKYKDFDWLQINKTEALIHLGRREEAYEFCSGLCIPSYSFEEALVKCGEIQKDSLTAEMERLYDEERFEEVIQICDEIGDSPKTADYRIASLIRLQRNDEALECIDRAIGKYPCNYNLHLIRAEISKTLEEAIESYEKAFEILGSTNNVRLDVRQYVHCLDMKACDLIVCGDYDGAIETCRKAMKACGEIGG